MPFEKNKILLGPCEEVLRTLPDETFDAVVTDPPYGLGTKEPTAQDIEAYLQGKALDTGGDFMGKAWEIPSVPTWQECYRVLKPGGYVLSFAGTRTWDIMSVGLRAAGFDNRDTISSLFGSPCLQWLHGQGFPKSTNISKKLRERAVKETSDEEKARLDKLADLFEGYGTALKPAWEPILCFRKPLVEPTLADQVAVTGTGGLNIDGSRIKHASPEDFAKHKEQVERIKSQGGSWDGSWKNSSDLTGANEVTSEGRWPANVILTHSPECVQVGTRTADAPTINRFTDGMKPFGDGAGHPYESSGGGEEEIPVYECVTGCPVQEMDYQSGVLRPRGNVNPTDRSTTTGFTRGGAGEPGTINPKDLGGASKFFPQFVPDAPFFYTGKASKKEKNDGIINQAGKVSNKKGTRVVRLKDGDLSTEDTERLVEFWTEKASPKGAALESRDPRQPTAEWDIPEEIRDLFIPAKQEDNVHPTVKPVSLMAWLVGLVTPVGGLVLDPYCGSGTTCVAAIDKECDFVAIERDPLYKALAEKRLLSKEKLIDTRKSAKALDDVLATLTGDETYDS